MCDSSIGRMDSHPNPRLTHAAPSLPLSLRWIISLLPILGDEVHVEDSDNFPSADPSTYLHKSE
jgi:hypothetical protein